MNRCQRALGWAVLACSVLLARGADAAGKKKDALAEKALKKALDEDYLETRFDDAEKRIRSALQTCSPKDACSPEVVAKLHAALGSVLAGGKKQLEDARDEFIEALTIDPKLTPDPDITSAEVTFAFENAQKKLKIAPSGKQPEGGGDAGGDKTAPEDGKAGGKDKGPKKVGESWGDKTLEPPDIVPQKPVEPPPAEKPARKNWITLTFSPDIAVVSGQDVCSKDVRTTKHFICLRENGTRYDGTPQLGNADNINAGVALSTLRLMLGYDRVLGDNFSLGARAGFIFNGASGPGVSFIPVHFEGRFGFWPRHLPFADAGVRPFLMASGGFGEVDTKVKVNTLEDGFACGAMPPESSKSACTTKSPDGTIEKRQQQLTVFKQAGTAFASLSAGLQFAPIPNFGINLAVRGSVTFPVVIPVISPELGLSLGF